MKKKTALIAMLAAFCIVFTGCSKSEDSSSSGAAADSESSSQDDLKATIDKQQKTIDEQNKKLEKLTNIIGTMIGSEDPESIYADDFVYEQDFDFETESHAIYDDMAVIEAYRSGDNSKLTDEKDQFILEEASKTVKELIKDDMTDFEKEKAIYDFIFEQSRFDEGNLSPIPHMADNSANPYGVLHDHTAICVGNATTFKLFMDMIGIDCKIIHSTEEGEHAWNMVKIDGDWYHVDVTFDGGEKEPMYTKLNVTDEIKEQDSYPWDHDEFPKADSMKANYVVQKAKKLDSVYDSADMFKKAIDKKKTACYFKLPLEDNGTKDKAYRSFYNYIFSEISYQISDGYDAAFTDGFVYDGYYYGGMFINYSSDDNKNIEDDTGELDYSNINFDTGRLYDEYLDKFGVDITIDKSMLL